VANIPPAWSSAEAPIDALSVAALEAIRTDTLYAATGGGIGPATGRLKIRVKTGHIDK
jgi:hypothetical protein